MRLALYGPDRLRLLSIVHHCTLFGCQRVNLATHNNLSEWRLGMDERTTLRVLSWSIGGVVALVFVLNAVALAAI